MKGAALSKASFYPELVRIMRMKSVEQHKQWQPLIYTRDDIAWPFCGTWIYLLR